MYFENQELVAKLIVQAVNKMFERHFVLTPWVREKRLRNQLRLILKDHLDAGPQRRSTTTKLVHDAHQVFPVWRNQIREKVAIYGLKKGG